MTSSVPLRAIDVHRIGGFPKASFDKQQYRSLLRQLLRRSARSTKPRRLPRVAVLFCVRARDRCLWCWRSFREWPPGKFW
jgi:hypothetical protein